ncbi:MAG TPA: hypothetical protein DEA90_00375 [Opitutae bacterium]|nr:hypothetical protein [Puniceicoccaceae bacterium]HBR92602.1 hypothetical protein [Opitutae bacterium]
MPPGLLKNVYLAVAAINLQYTAVAESYGIISLDTINPEGLLSITPGAYSVHGDHTRVAIRASKPNGESAVAILKVRMVDIRTLAQVA